MSLFETSLNGINKATFEEQSERAKAIIASMSPEKLSSMYAYQALSYALSYHTGRIHDGKDQAGAGRRRIAQVFEMLKGDINTYPYERSITDSIRLLLPADREAMIADLEKTSAGFPPADA